MNDTQRKQIEEIIGGMECPEDFKCYASEFENLCKATDNGIRNHVDCLKEPATRCSFALSFGHIPLCRCPLRVYLSKTLRL